MNRLMNTDDRRSGMLAMLALAHCPAPFQENQMNTKITTDGMRHKLNA